MANSDCDSTFESMSPQSSQDVIIAAVALEVVSIETKQKFKQTQEKKSQLKETG